ncbi:MAG: hypothetical protein MAG715_00430 [Methanonatronarchaeales archaeon]|nr:hypothetical protein [Methanonatronarchaeales archaeon]
MRRKALPLLALLLLAAVSLPGCVEETGTSGEELEVSPTYDLNSLDGYAGDAGEALYVFPGSRDSEQALEEVVAGDAAPPDEVPPGFTLVVFRGVFSTGGHSLRVDRILRDGGELVIHATYRDLGEGEATTQVFTQPAAFVPMELPPGRYDASLFVTRMAGEEVVERGRKHLETSFRVVG